MPDEFDEDLEAIDALREDIVGDDEQKQIEEDTPKVRRNKRTIQAILERPEVAEMFRRGEPMSKIAKTLGVSYSAVRKMYLNPSIKMRDLMESEAKRVALHLSTRDLENESYSKLVFGMRQLNEQVALEDGKPTSRTEIFSQGSVESIEIALQGFIQGEPTRNRTHQIASGEDESSPTTQTAGVLGPAPAVRED